MARNRHHLALAGSLAGFVTGTMLLESSAQAEFLGLACEPYVGDGWVENGYEGLATYRVYAEFDECCMDGVFAVFGIAGVPLTASSGDGAFHNAPKGLDRLTAPEDLRGVGVWENQWDTYVTINATDATGDATATSDGFATETNDLATDWSTESGAWFVTPIDEQRLHVDGRVLIAQFTVASGVGISGVVNLLLVDGKVEAAQLPVPSCAPPCPEDADGNGEVGFGDVLAILGAWENIGGAEDVDGDGVVGFGDVLAVLAAWGPCD